MKRALDPLVARCGFLYPSGLDKGFKNPEKPIQIKYLGKFSLSEPRVFQGFGGGGVDSKLRCSFRPALEGTL